MKRIIALLLVSLFVMASYGLDRYASRMTPDGTIYFIMPKKLSKLQGIKHFDYDMTLLSWTDSVTVNFTFKSRIIGLPSNLTIKSGNRVFKCDNYSLLFQDIIKTGFEIRVTSKFSTEDLKEIIQSDVPPIFYFDQENNKESATYSEGAWRKERKQLMDIFKLYQYTKSR